MATTITPITQSITTIPTAGHRGVESRDDFVTKQEAFQDALTATTVTELNTLKTQLNTSIGQINLVAGEASTSAATATTKASAASASVTSASTSAATATTKASEASASATSASTSASEALTSRNQAETFAQQAQSSAASVDANNIVHKTGNETIAGVKKFSSSPIVPTPTDATQAANKTYVDTQVTGLGTAATYNVGTAVGQIKTIGDVPTYCVDIDDGTQRGRWYVSNTTAGTRPTTYGMVNTFGADSDAVNQEYVSVTGDGSPAVMPRFFRNKYGNNAWSPWVEMHHTGNLLQTTGTSTYFPMSQKVVTDAIITEKVYNLTGTAINPTNGTIQYKTVSANTTFTETLTAGQSVLLRLIGANSYTITFPTITWVGVTAPILTANCAIVLWKEQSTLYGAFVGSLV